MLAYTGVEFVDKRYNIYGGPKVFDKHEWTDEKFQLGLDFANVSCSLYKRNILYFLSFSL